MAITSLAQTLVLTIILVCCISLNGVYCVINTQCRGTECTLEDLGLDTDINRDKMLQNLTAAISKFLQSPLRIHITHDYNSSCNPRCGPATDPARPPSTISTPDYARDCSDVAAQGHDKSGVYKVRPSTHPVVVNNDETHNHEFEVYCDLESEDGAWTVFQRRQDGLGNFFRGWADYKQGFGYHESEFWLGLDKLHRLTTQGRYRLKVVLQKANGDTAYAIYDRFKIGDEEASYKLLLGDYEGTAGDSMTFHAGMLFSTKDRDNDPDSTNHCAQSYKGGWWYKTCHYANLNGLYLTPDEVGSSGIIWYHWTGNQYVSLKSTEMKIQQMV